MRNGNMIQLTRKADQKAVLTVPMRNGNGQEDFRMRYQMLSSYRTYEEWKLSLPFYF